MSNPENLPRAPDPPGSSPAARGARADLGIALAVSVGLAAACTLVSALSGSWTTGASLGAGLMVPGMIFAYVVLRRRHRDRFERTDERAQIIDLKSRATSLLAMAGLLSGVIVYRWLHDGYASAEPFLSILAAVGIVQAVTHYSLKRRS
jgi:hypothetical protein